MHQFQILRAKSLLATYRAHQNRASNRGLKISDLKPVHVENWFDEAYANSTDNAPNGIITAVRRPFNWAVKRGMLGRSPIVGVERPRTRPREVDQHMQLRTDHMQSTMKQAVGGATEHPQAKPKPKKGKAKRKRGAQHGHPKFQRELIASDECEKIAACKPDACRGCGAPDRHVAGADRTGGLEVGDSAAPSSGLCRADF